LVWARLWLHLEMVQTKIKSFKWLFFTFLNPAIEISSRLHDDFQPDQHAGRNFQTAISGQHNKDMNIQVLDLGQFYIGMPNTNELEDWFEIDSEPYRTNACILKAHSHSKSGGSIWASLECQCCFWTAGEWVVIY
jgi:hypothetical protein